MTTKYKFLHVPLYPFLIALAPVFSLYALNRLALNSLDLIRPSVVCLVVALAAVSMSRAVSNSSRSSAILGCVLLVSVFEYGHAFRSVYVLSGLESLNSYFLPIWLALTGVVYAVLAHTLRRTKNSLTSITLIFNISGIALIAVVLMPIVLDSITSQRATWVPGDRSDSDRSLHSEWLPAHNADWKNKKRPDVYYIVLDGYARGDVLQSRFDFDNSEFLDWLDMKGFFVGNRSHSNYPSTHLSLSATLNGEYLQTLLPEELGSYAPAEYRSRYQFFKGVLSNKYIKTSRVHRFFSSLGYRIISNGSRHAITRQNSASLADAMLGYLNEFEQVLINRTIFMHLISKPRRVKQLRVSKFDLIVRTLEQLGSIAKEDGPKFVFYHVMSPHAPFCFDENGGMMPQHPVYDASPWLEDKRLLPGYDAWVMENYPRTVAGLNIYVKAAIKSILDESAGNAIVIIQADHGSNSGVDPHSAGRTDIVERFGILNAIFLPANFPSHGLEQTMSSVNTFRIVLQNIFDIDLPALENRAFHSRGDLKFEEVTHRLQDQPVALHVQ